MLYFFCCYLGLLLYIDTQHDKLTSKNNLLLAVYKMLCVKKMNKIHYGAQKKGLFKNYRFKQPIF